MKLKKIHTFFAGLIVITMVLGFLPLTGKTNNKAFAIPTRLGLHVTQEELAIWRDRAVNGPYKERNDAGRNSPAEWQRIANNAERFLIDPSAERWIPNLLEGTTCPAPENMGGEPDREQGDKLRDAAFYYLLFGGEVYLTAVRNELINQVSEPTTDFTNMVCEDSLWQNQHDHASRMLKQLFAYDYVRNELSEQERTVLDKWFLEAAVFYQKLIDKAIGKAYIDRFGPNKRPTQNAINHEVGEGRYAYYGGPEMHSVGLDYNNRATVTMAFVGSVGIMLENELLMRSAKEFVKEFIEYSIYADGTLTDFIRVTTKNEEQGWSYSVHQGDGIVMIADAFARTGDTSLYEYKATGGYYDAYGENKDLLLMMKGSVSYIDGTFERYGTSDPINVGDPTYLINGWKSVPDGKVGGYVYDVSWAQANIYYQDQQVKDAYTRQSVSWEYPRTPLSGGANSWGGVSGVYPSKLFMFGQMEGEVWPYSAATSDSFEIKGKPLIRGYFDRPVDSLSPKQYITCTVEFENNTLITRDEMLFKVQLLNEENEVCNFFATKSKIESGGVVKIKGGFILPGQVADLKLKINAFDLVSGDELFAGIYPLTEGLL